MNELEKQIEKMLACGFRPLIATAHSAPMKEYWHKSAFRMLANQCSIGDVRAMEQLTEFFVKKAKRTFNIKEKEFFQCAANFWRVRAWLYGSEIAEKTLVAFYDKHPEKALESPNITEQLSGKATGKQLNALGFLFFDETVKEEYYLNGVDEQGVVEVHVWVDEDMDTDGFGLEYEYNWWYLNEHLVLPEGIGYISHNSYHDKWDCEEKFLALHDQVAAASARDIISNEHITDEKENCSQANREEKTILSFIKNT